MKDKDIISLQDDRDNANSFIQYSEDRRKHALRLHRWRSDKRPIIRKEPAFGYNEESGNLEYYDTKTQAWKEVASTSANAVKLTQSTISSKQIHIQSSITEGGSNVTYLWIDPDLYSGLSYTVEVGVTNLAAASWEVRNFTTSQIYFTSPNTAFVDITSTLVSGDNLIRLLSDDRIVLKLVVKVT